MIVTDYPDANLMENLAHNVVVNYEVEEKRRVDVQSDFSKFSFFIYLLKILIGIGLGQARLFLTIIGTLVCTITASKFDLTILLSDHSLVYEVF